MKAYTYINKGEFALIDKPKPTIIEHTPTLRDAEAAEAHYCLRAIGRAPQLREATLPRCAAHNARRM